MASGSATGRPYKQLPKDMELASLVQTAHSLQAPPLAGPLFKDSSAPTPGVAPAVIQNETRDYVGADATKFGEAELALMVNYRLTHIVTAIAMAAVMIFVMVIGIIYAGASPKQVLITNFNTDWLYPTPTITPVFANGYALIWLIFMATALATLAFVITAAAPTLYMYIMKRVAMNLSSTFYYVTTAVVDIPLMWFINQYMGATNLWVLIGFMLVDIAYRYFLWDFRYSSKDWLDKWFTADEEADTFGPATKRQMDKDAKWHAFFMAALFFLGSWTIPSFYYWQQVIAFNSMLSPPVYWFKTTIWFVMTVFRGAELILVMIRYLNMDSCCQRGLRRPDFFEIVNVGLYFGFLFLLGIGVALVEWLL